MVRVQKGTEHEPRRGTVLGWNVDDLEAVVTRVEEAGAAFQHYGFPGQDERGIMTFPDGSPLAWFRIPRSFLELSLQTRPRGEPNRPG